MLICHDRVNGSGCGAKNMDNAKHCQQCGMSLRYALVLLNDGVIVGSYQISYVIGYGGFGAVYAAEDTRTRQEVALKETFDTNSTRAFQSEFNVLHRLSHDHLPHYYEMFEEQGNGYLVMELIPGQSLLDVLQRRQGQSLAEAQVMGYAIQICDALIYLHAQTPTLIHRDIKPANIRLTPEGLIKLVDFGLLKQGTDKTGKSRMGLTPAYAPLEQWGNTGMHTTPQSDIYSLGATLYHLLTGQPPLTVTDRIADDDPLLSPHQINPRVTPHVSDAIMKALSIQPKQRFVDALSFKQALIYANTPALQTTIPGTQPKTDSEPAQVTEPNYVSEPTQVLSGLTYSSALNQFISEPREAESFFYRIPRWAIIVAVVVVLSISGFMMALNGHNSSNSATHIPTNSAIVIEESTDTPTPLSTDTPTPLSTDTPTPPPTNTPTPDFYQQGEKALTEDHYEEAIQQFTAAIQNDPQNAKAYNGRGEAYYELSEYGLALQDYDQALALDDTFVEAYNNRASIYKKYGEYEKALDDYNQAITLDDTYVSAYNNRGTVYHAKGELDLAIEDYSTAIALDENYPVAYPHRASAYKAKGDYDKAIQDYNKAITLDAHNPTIYNNRGIVYYLKNDYDNALQDYTQAIALDEKNAQAYYNRGTVYQAKGDEELAIADFRQCQALAREAKDTALQQMAEEQLRALGETS